MFKIDNQTIINDHTYITLSIISLSAIHLITYICSNAALLFAALNCPMLIYERTNNISATLEELILTGV